MLKKSILFYTVCLLSIYILTNSLLAYVQLTFLSHVKLTISILIAIGIILGSIQLIIHDEDKITSKIIYSLFITILEIILILPFFVWYLLFIYNDEKVVYKNQQPMVAEISIKAESSSISYYDYKYFLIRSKQVRFSENMNEFEKISKEENYDYY